MQLRLKILLLGLGLLGSSCGSDFDWDPDPYVGDSVSQSLVNSEGLVIRSDEPRFDQMTCFTSQNISELRSAIAQVEDKVVQAKAQKAAKVIDEKVWYAKEEKNSLK